MAYRAYTTSPKDDWSVFEKVFSPRVVRGDVYENEFILPRRWDGRDFYGEVNRFLSLYLDKVKEVCPEKRYLLWEIKTVCDKVRDIVGTYLHGYPANAYSKVKDLMKRLEETPLYVEREKIGILYRMTKVDENLNDKARIFHAPYNIRGIIRTYRYSIAGYPALYLADSLKLAEEETRFFAEGKKAIAAKFEMDDRFRTPLLKILDFGVRPQDLAPQKGVGESDAMDGVAVRIRQSELEAEARYSDKIRPGFSNRNAKKVKPQKTKAGTRVFEAWERYMKWYPLIAVCSYVRTDREAPFAPEYIVPQLLTQWLRSESTGELVGIRYFSCYSQRASSMGVNYVFPTSGECIILKDGIRQYCPVLNEAFRLSEPEYIMDHRNAEALQHALRFKRTDRAFRLTRKDFINREEVDIPEGTMYIPTRAFTNCDGLKRAAMPESVISIGDEAFMDCKQLSSDHGKLPESIMILGDSAFYGCKNLDLVELPKKLNTIGNYVFYNCLRLKLDKLPPNLKSIGDGAFGDCVELDLKKLPESIDEIGAFAFAGCTKLSLKKLPDGLRKISYQAFNQCSELALETLPKRLNRICENGFAGCEKLAIKALPADLQFIEYRAFDGCEAITVGKLPRGLKEIGARAFEKCRRITVNEIPRGITKIEYRAFCGCTGITDMRFHDGIVAIGDRAFSGCTGLTKIVMPPKLEELGDDAFNSCIGLETVEIPAGIKKLGFRAFSGCTKLKTIRYGGTKEDWDLVMKGYFWDDTETDCTLYFADGSSIKLSHKSVAASA